MLSSTGGRDECYRHIILAHAGGSWREVVDIGESCRRELVNESTESGTIGFFSADDHFYLWVRFDRNGGTGEEVHDDTFIKLFEFAGGEISEVAHLLLGRTTRRKEINESCYNAALDDGYGEYDAYSSCPFDEAVLSEWMTRLEWQEGELQIHRTSGTPPGWLLGAHPINEVRALSQRTATFLETP